MSVLDRDRRVFVVLNPRSGVGSALYLKEDVLAGLRGLDVRYSFLGRGDRLRVMVDAALEAGANEVVAVGGDGTVSGVAEAVAGTDAAMGIVPTGTANMVARELGIPLSIASATGVIRRRERIVGMDCMTSGDRSFVYQVAVGMGADLNRLVTRNEKEVLGRSAYMVAMFRALGELRPLYAHCRIDGRQVEMWVNQLVIANAGILGTEPLRLGPGIRPDDGKVEVVAMRGRGRLDYLSSGMSMVLGNFQDPGLRYYEVRHEVVLETRPRTAIKADGEYIGETPLTLRVRPGAVKVITPTRPRTSWPPA
ncbi:MAG: diacylglycerol kinase family protein [Methanomassiliicoccus sp.]|nr:diacylglycerol kinase family protein [Methanomassiliicoccus sp.]